jgi:small subunit ribosomal protein S20
LAHTKSAKKMIAVSREQRKRNRAVKRSMKTFVDKAVEFIAAKDLENAKEAVRKATAVIDKAVKKGVIHPNNAARRKSRLMRKFNAAFPHSPAK